MPRWPHRTTEERFWEKVDQYGADDCWPWNATTRRKGYGKFYLPEGAVSSHRFAWETTGREIPPGLFVLHKCDNPPCCNPSHLFLGTNLDNMKDKVLKGRPSGVRGERNGAAVLSREDVMAMRLEYDSSRARNGRAEKGIFASMALRFFVSAHHAKDICRRRYWKHV